MTNYEQMLSLEYTRLKIMSNHSVDVADENRNKVIKTAANKEQEKKTKVDHAKNSEDAAQKRHKELMDVMTKPKTVVRDKEGRIAGVQ